MRGSHPGSFEAAHHLRDTRTLDTAHAQNTSETYDLVIVGGGQSGPAAAQFFHKYTGGGAKVLVLDNHDDFGGHAKRNEFHYDGKTFIGYGGTMAIATVYPYSYGAKALLKDLGIDVASYPQFVNRD